MHMKELEEVQESEVASCENKNVEYTIEAEDTHDTLDDAIGDVLDDGDAIAGMSRDTGDRI